MNYVDPTGHKGIGNILLNAANRVINPKKKHGGTQINNNSFADDPGQKTIYSPYWVPYTTNRDARNLNADMNEEQWLFERANASGNFSLATWHKQKAEELKRKYEAFYCGNAKAVGVFDSINDAYDSLTEREQQHLKLDATGLIPGLGIVFDGTNAILYLTEGDFTNAGLSALSLIPGGGDVIGGIALGAKVVKVSDKVSSFGKLVYYSEKSGRTTRELGDAGIDIGKANIKNTSDAADLILTAKRSDNASDSDAYHYAGMFLSKEQLEKEKIYSLTNRKGDDALLLQTEVTLNGKKGVIEYIVEKDGVISHQYFKEGKRVDGHVLYD